MHALEQTNGRGRHGRTWHSGKNNLTFSFVYNSNCPVEISPITIFAGLALRKALSRVTSSRIQIKWPNDVTCLGKKLGGILSEMVQAGQSRAVIFGIGVNLNSADFPPELIEKTTSLKDIANQDLQPETVLYEIMLEMQAYLPLYRVPLSQNILSEFGENRDQNANMVSVYDPGDRTMTKKKFNIAGINEMGLLRVIDESGNPGFINAHELEYT